MKKGFILMIFCLFSMVVFSQGAIGKKRTLSDKVFFGGGFGLQLYSVVGVDVSPIIGYRPFPSWSVGFKGNYQFYKKQDMDFTTQIYGGSLFSTYTFFENVVVYAEFESLNIDYSYFNPYTSQTQKDRYWVHSPLIGGGFVQPIGERSRMLIMLLWNLNESTTTPYSNPILKIM